MALSSPPTLPSCKSPPWLFSWKLLARSLSLFCYSTRFMAFAKWLRLRAFPGSHCELSIYKTDWTCRCSPLSYLLGVSVSVSCPSVPQSNLDCRVQGTLNCIVQQLDGEPLKDQFPPTMTPLLMVLSTQSLNFAVHTGSSIEVSSDLLSYWQSHSHHSFLHASPPLIACILPQAWVTALLWRFVTGIRRLTSIHVFINWVCHCMVRLLN